MRKLVALALTLCAVTLPAFGQIVIPNSGNATQIGSFTASTTIEVYDATKKKGEVDVEWHIIVWSTGSNDTVFSIAPSTIGFSNDEGVVDDLTAVEIFDALGPVTVRKGVALGYLACASDCDNPNATLVYTSSCVERSGSGNNTHFDHHSGASVRGYDYCCEGGPTTVTFTGANGTGSCSGQNIESTWNGAGGGPGIN